MTSRENCSALLKSPTREPINAACNCKLRGLYQECYRLIGLPVIHTRDGEVDQESNPGMWRTRLRKRLFKEFRCSGVAKQQERLTGVARDSCLVPYDKQASRISLAARHGGLRSRSAARALRPSPSNACSPATLAASQPCSDNEPLLPAFRCAARSRFSASDGR
jgi:hypothetical protein